MLQAGSASESENGKAVLHAFIIYMTYQQSQNAYARTHTNTHMGTEL